jgi:hypothetical protein
MGLRTFFRSLDHFSKFRYKLWYYPTKICIKNIKNEILLAAIFESQALCTKKLPVCSTKSALGVIILFSPTLI